MIKKTLKVCRHTVIITVEVIGGIAFLGGAATFALLWRFSQGPVDVTFAADYVRQALASNQSGVEVKFDSIVAQWPRFDGPISLGLSGFKIVEQGHTALDVKSVGLRVAKAPLLVGLFKPEAIILDSPTLKFVREENGAFRLLMAPAAEAGAKPEEVGPADSESASLRSIGESFFLGGTLPYSDLSILSKLEHFALRNAKLQVEDRIAKSTWEIPDVNARLDRKKNAFSLGAEYKAPGSIQSSLIDLKMQRTKGSTAFDAKMQNVDAALFARYLTLLEDVDGQRLILNGEATGTLDEAWALQKLDGNLTSEGGFLAFGADHKNTVSIEELAAQLSYDRATGKISMHDTKLRVNDIAAELSAERDISAGADARVPVVIKIQELSLAQIQSMWPSDSRNNPAAEWLTQKLSDGILKNLVVNVAVDPKNPANITTDNIKAAFDFTNLTADYRAPMIPVTAASGHAIMADDALDIEVDKGKLVDMAVGKSSVKITNLTRPEPGVVNVDVALTGPMHTVFDYISKDPINQGGVIQGDRKNIKGAADLKVHVDFPAIRDLPADAVKVTVDSTLVDTRFPGIVRGLDLTGGPYKLKVQGGAFTLSGKGFLDDRPIDLVYSEYLDPKTAPYASDITAKVSADKKLRDAFGIHLDQFIEGEVPVSLHYKEPKKGDISIDVTADLTPTRFRIRPFNYDKAIGINGTATCVARVAGRDIQEIRDLTVTVGKDVAGTGTIKFGQVGKEQDVKTGTFKVDRLGGDNNFLLTFEQTAPNAFTFDLKGDVLDARSFLDAREQQPVSSDSLGPSVKVTTNTQRMRTGDKPDQFLKAARLSADVDGKGDIRSLDLSATSGTAPLSLTIKPDAAGVMQLNFTAADAGSTLRAFDVFDSMVGGTLKIKGSQISGGGPNDLKGRASISDFTLMKAPALAQLINAFSISGLAELLQNKGISFTRLKADFTWKKKPEGRIISVMNGRTSGASIGLTFGGLVNQTKGEMDISGTVVPMSEINKLVNKIPLIGTLLTGGSNGGLIAATYAMKGATDNPSVIINPLSVLTPGFLRSILFEGGLDTKTDEDLDAPAAPVKKKMSDGLNR